MAANIRPIYSKVGHIEWCSLTAANTATDGTGTVGTLFTADATNGSRVERIRMSALGTNVASLARLFINNGSANTSAANNALISEFTLVANTLSQTTQQTINELPNSLDVILPLVLPPGYRLLVTLGTAVSAGVMFVALGGDY